MNRGTALIAGATGLIGGHCLRTALNYYDRVITLTRRPLAIEHPRLIPQVINFDQLSALDLRADDVFSALGSNLREVSWETFARIERDYPIALARRAVECGARQFAFVSTADVSWLSKKWARYTRLRRDAEDAIAALPFHAVHIFRPGLLGGVREKARIGETLLFVTQRPFAWVLRGSWTKYRPILGRDVARAMVAAALRRQPGVHVYHYDEMHVLARSLPDPALQIVSS